MSFSYNVLKTETEVKEGVQDIATQILVDFPPDPDVPPEKKPLFVAFLKGVTPFAKDLMFEIERQSPGYNPQMDFMLVSTYKEDGKPSEPRIKLDLDDKKPIKDRPIIIVEDLLDTGTTIDFVSKHLRALGANTINVAVLAEKVQPRENEARANYLAFEFDPEPWLAGYGMDHAQAGPDAMRWRPEILEVVRSGNVAPSEDDKR